MKPPKSVIFGCSSTRISPEERHFFTQHNPVGFILFARNIENPEQVKALIEELKSCVSHEHCLILIDQEGGRVARLAPPHWDAYPPVDVFAKLAQKDLEKAKNAIYLNYRLIGDDLHQLGINVNCAPVLDIPVAGSDDIIGDRALGNEPKQVAILGRAVCDGLMDAAVLPVIKHIPGHGRATVDSHLALPKVEAAIDILERTDFTPFKMLCDMPIAMTAHISYTMLDPNHCATMSPLVIDYIRTQIGFEGLLLSDDLSMKALEGEFATRAEKCLTAGCDVILHCNGNMDEMLEIASKASDLSKKSARRLKRSYEKLNPIKSFIDRDKTQEKITNLLRI